MIKNAEQFCDELLKYDEHLPNYLQDRKVKIEDIYHRIQSQIKYELPATFDGFLIKIYYKNVNIPFNEINFNYIYGSYNFTINCFFYNYQLITSFMV